MDFLMRPTPINKKFITPGVIILILLAINALVFLAIRFIFGLGATTNYVINIPGEYGLQLM